MTIAIISHPDCLLHDPKHGHPESPARVDVIQHALANYPFNVPVNYYEAPLATQDQLRLAHDEEYVDWLFSIAPKKFTIRIDEDTMMTSHTLTAALRAAGAVILAVDLVMQQKERVVFCNVRPPGHHAERDKAMGFCFFNNVAIGVLYALEHYHLNRIAIVDFDVHHGNGTQNIFQKDKRVLYCSSFQHPLYPGYEEEKDNAHILSIPLEAGTTGAVFREKVQEKWLPAIAAFKPELIFFSAGFDGHVHDPLASLNLTKADYVWITEQIEKIAREQCGGKMISVLEGGYNLEALADCVPAHVNAMMKKA